MIYKKLFPEGKCKALTFSYDDGVEQDLRLQKIFRRYHMKATFNLNSALMKEESSWDIGPITIRRLGKDIIENEYGDFEVAVHSATHPFLDKMPSDMIGPEILSDRIELESMFHYPVKGMAYPFGTYHDDLIAQLRAMGIVYSRTVESTGDFLLPKDFLKWHPTCHHKDERLMSLADEFLSIREAGRDWQVFYVWGHSYEFDVDRNWDVIESFCEKMADKDDIWYATNMEIYQYVWAADQLITSCDGSCVYNPTAIDIWIAGRTNKLACVSAGQTLIISSDF